jgi:hypothetical protein
MRKKHPYLRRRRRSSCGAEEGGGAMATGSINCGVPAHHHHGRRHHHLGALHRGSKTKEVGFLVPCSWSSTEIVRPFQGCFSLARVVEMFDSIPIGVCIARDFSPSYRVVWCICCLIAYLLAYVESQSGLQNTDSVPGTEVVDWSCSLVAENSGLLNDNGWSY